MELKKNIIGENEYTFVCEYWETSRAWGHKVTMLKNGYEMATNKVRYYNRTWEMYRYQTCILGAIYTVLEQEKEKAVARYKSENNVSRLSQDKKEQIYNASKIITELRELYKARELRA